VSAYNLAFLLMQLGRSDEALSQVLDLLQRLLSRSQPGGLWLELLQDCTVALAHHARAGQLPDWDVHFAALSTALRTVIDLESPEQLAAARAGISGFYARYLALCIELKRHDLIPAVLAARQGRKLAALVLEELDAQGEALDPDSLRGRFQALRLELRRLALGLRVVTKAGAMPRQARRQRLDAADAIARQRQQWETYKAKLEDYRTLRAELEQTDPEFQVAAAALHPSLDELQARLGEAEALVLLFEHGGEAAPSGATTRWALLITATASMLVPLVDVHLRDAITVAQTGIRRRHTRAGMRQAFGLSEHTLLLRGDREGDRASDPLRGNLQAGLWEPLTPHLTGLSRLHLVTHGTWHLLPLELGAPTGLRLATYPGFIYYHRVRHQGVQPAATSPVESPAAAPFAPSQSTVLGLAVDAAEDNPALEPIPFVHAEAELITALWPGPVHTTPDLGADTPILFALQLSGHGQIDAKDPARANVRLADRVLDMHAVLGARQQPLVVVLSACTVGRTSEDSDGEPLGLVGSFLLKGACYVVASLQPVPDFYMPLLVILFYQAWMETGSPETALLEAKARLASGNWPPDTAELICTHYRPILEGVLAEVQAKPKATGTKDPLLRLTHAWPFPAPYRALHPEKGQDVLEALRERLKTAPGRASMAAGVLDTLVAERARLPTAVTETLCTWVRGFGSA
jgi:hypothetical protein